MTRFLRQLLLRCDNWTANRLGIKSVKVLTWLGHELSAGDRVSRFIYSERNIFRAQGRPKPPAFNPSPYKRLSVTHTTELADPQVWEIGAHTLGTNPGRTTIYARADVPVAELIEQKLRTIRDDFPLERHTSVVGWPVSQDANEQKALWKQICLELSQSPNVKLVLPPSPIVRSLE